jgi:hypothetical protein
MPLACGVHDRLVIEGEPGKPIDRMAASALLGMSPR